MTKYLNRISGLIPNTYKEINIVLNGKSLIVTGANGSGKTSFLKAVFDKVDLLIAKKKYVDFTSMEESLRFQKDYFSRRVPGTTDYVNAKRVLDKLELEISQVANGLQLEMVEHMSFSNKMDEKIAIIKLFTATRTANITHADTARGLKTVQLENIEGNNQNPGRGLEQHLVNLKNRSSLAVTHDKDTDLADKIVAWFVHFESNLKELMEDASTKLRFDADTLKFSILQDGKPPYDFQTLSSGYMAIFDIYADLLMRTEYFSVTPAELSGLVFIDEIDAHLHVSLQRLILPFLERSFPEVQFIVTTHSPFVLMSVNDAVIFDISRNDQVEGDLSQYSYTAVIEGLLGTKPSSILIEKIIAEIATIAAAANKDYDRLEVLLSKITEDGKGLDNRNRAFYLLGVNALLEREGQ